MGANLVERTGKVDVTPIFFKFRLAFRASGYLNRQGTSSVCASKLFSYRNFLAEPFRYDVSCATERFVGRRHFFINEWTGAGLRVRGLELPDDVCQSFQPQFLRHCRAGPSLRLEWKVKVFQLGGVYGVLDSPFQLLREFSRFLYGLDYGGLAFFHIVEGVSPMLHLGDLTVVHSARLFLSVPAYEGDGVSVFEKQYAILYLPLVE